MGGLASARIEWKRPDSLSQTVVPQSQLYPAIMLDDLPDTAPVLGTGTGLKAQYYADRYLVNLVSTKIDPTVNFNWGTGGPMASVGPDEFSVRWTGQVQAIESGLYNFTTTTDDGLRLWVNNQLLINKWVDQGYLPWSGSINLTAGQKYDLKMEYYEASAGAAAQLAWRRPGQSSDEVVPQPQLFPAS